MSSTKLKIEFTIPNNKMDRTAILNYLYDQLQVIKEEIIMLDNDCNSLKMPFYKSMYPDAPTRSLEMCIKTGIFKLDTEAP